MTITTRDAPTMSDTTVDALAEWLPGTSDSRSLTVRGHSFYVSRSTSLEFGFHGGGRDGDVVADDAPQFAILDPLIAGIAGVRPAWGPTFTADTPAALDAVEPPGRWAVPGAPPARGASVAA